MSKISTPQDLLLEELKDLYSAENQLLKALPRMAKNASDDQLRKAFEQHAKETRNQIAKLDKIGKRLGKKLTGKKCHAMEGLIEEAKEILEEDGEPMLLDHAMIGAAQKVEHYEIAGYGTARTLAELIGEDDIAATLQEILDEEGETDKKLTAIALEIGVEVPVEDDEE